VRVEKSVKVTEETHKRLLKVMGTLQAKEGRRKTVEDTGKILLGKYERNKKAERNITIRYFLRPLITN